MATIHDVAKQAGVSVATISRYFNQGYVGKGSREKIEKVIEALDFKPNAVARALNNKSSKIIGLIVPSIFNPFFPELAQAVEEEATRYGYRLMLCSSESRIGSSEALNLDKEAEFIEFMVLNHADGIITSTGNCSEIYNQLNLPVVSVDRELHAGNGHVTSDNLEGGRLALRHLESCGCKKAAFVGDAAESGSQAQRRIGFVEEALSRGVATDVFLIGQGPEQTALTELIPELANYDGVFAWNDTVAVEILHGFHQAGVSVPEDVSLIGFDNVHISQIFIPAITTIGQQIHEMGRKAVEMLMNAIAEPQHKEAVCVLEVALLCRETTQRRRER